MNTRERFLRVMRFEPVDRVPNFELAVWEQTLDRWRTEGLPADAMPTRLLHWGCDYFGIDRRDPVGVSLAPIPAFEEETLEETDRHLLYRDPEGRVRKALKVGESRGYRTSMDQYVDFPIKNRADFEAFKRRLDPRSPQRYPPDWEQCVAAWKSRDCPVALPDNPGMGFFWTLREWMGTVNACYVFYDDPKLAHEMMDFIADFLMETLHKVLHDVEIDYFNFSEDFAYKAGPIISPKIFREFMLPRYRRVTDFMKSHGVASIWLDTDGNFELLIPLMLEAGIDCLWPLQIGAGIDPVALRKKYGQSLVMVGGIDKRELAKGRKEIERELIPKVPWLLERGGYIPTLDHGVPPDVSLDNFRYYLELKTKLLEGRAGA